MLIITGIFYDTKNELTIYAVLCRNVKIFYRQELASHVVVFTSSIQLGGSEIFCPPPGTYFGLRVFKHFKHKNCLIFGQNV